MATRGFTLLLAGVIACGGKIDSDSPEPGSSTSKKASPDKDDDERETPSSKPKPQPQPQPFPEPPPSSQCVYSDGSSSGGGDGTTYSCENTSVYACGPKRVDLTCACAFRNGVPQGGKCLCNGDSFPYDCSNGCSPSPEVYGRCNLPPPSFSGTSSGSSASSSGG